VRVARVQSFVTVANVRGRPVKIEQVAILKPNTMSHPRGWEFGQDLAEGQRATFTFDRDEYPNAVPVAMDTVGRVCRVVGSSASVLPSAPGAVPCPRGLVEVLNHDRSMAQASPSLTRELGYAMPTSGLASRDRRISESVGPDNPHTPQVRDLGHPSDVEAPGIGSGVATCGVAGPVIACQDLCNSKEGVQLRPRQPSNACHGPSFG